MPKIMGVLTDVYFRRQSIVLLANCLHSIGTGFMISFPSVLNPDILSPNSTSEIHATSDQASWIASSNGISGIFSFFVVPYFMQAFGRKSVSVVLNVIGAIGFVILALAKNVACLFAGRIMQGVPMCAVFVLSMALGEYAHPKRRGYFMAIKKSLVPIGALLCHSLASTWSWKHIAAVAVLPYVFAIFLTFLCPESPSFLALTGKYVECEKSHVWLFGDGPKSRKGLEDLISTQLENKQQAQNNKNLKSVFRSLLKRDFIKPFVMSSLLTMLTDACGRFYMPAYAVKILIGVTQDESITAYCTIGSDILTFAALLSSCFIIRCWKRRTLLFTSGMTCVILMCTISLLTFLEFHYDIGGYVYWWLTPLLILLNVFVANVGVIPTCFTIISEIYPLEHKGTGTCATGIVFAVLYSTVIKYTPIMMEKTGVEGTFGIYAFHMLVSLMILYFILNETKDKTLQEIEKEIKNVRRLKFGGNYSKEKPLMHS